MIELVLFVSLAHPDQRSIWCSVITGCSSFTACKLVRKDMDINEHERHKGSNTGKRARRKNLRHPRERFLVSNEALPSWRPIEIFPAGVWDFSVLPSYRCLILFLTNLTFRNYNLDRKLKTQKWSLWKHKIKTHK